MIPKIIHYCWYGGKPLPEKFHNYIEGWKIIMPNFEIKRWDESNSPMHIPYMQTAYKNKKWANLSNYTRLHAIYNEGGIYFDTDIEVLKSFEPLLSQSCFLGFEDIHIDWDGCVNNAVIGAIPKHPFIKEMLLKLPKEFDGMEYAHLSSPNFTTQLLKKKGLIQYGDQTISDIHIYPIDYFYPYSWHQNFSPECVTSNTYCIHRFEKSWENDIAEMPKRNFFEHYLYHIKYKINQWGKRLI